MAIEDFTGYTETDQSGDITVTAPKVDVDTMQVNVTSYVYSNKGTNYFGDFEHLLDIYTGNSSAADANQGVWAVADANYTKAQQRSNNNGLGVYLYRAGGFHRIYIYDYTNDNQDFYSADLITMYYLRIERSGTTFTCKIYASDANRDAETGALDTLSITCSTDAYDYIMVCNSEGAGGTENMTYYVENLDLQVTEAAAPSPTLSFGGVGNLRFYGGSKELIFSEL